MKWSIWPCLFFGCLFSVKEGKSQLTIFGGPQTTSVDYSIRGVNQSAEYKQGFIAGAGLKTLIEGPAFFSPMLYFSRKGYKVSFNERAFPPDSGALNNNTSINTIELAPLIQINLSKQPSYLFLRFGPSFDFNLSGREVFDTASNKKIDREMVFSFGDYSHATILLNAHLGFQHKSGLTIFTHYSHGLSSLNNADLGPSIFHRVAGVSLGWKFGKKR